MSMMLDIVTSIIKFLSTASTSLTLDVLFIISLAVEAVLVVFFLVKSAFSYEASLNRSLDKLNYWLFERKVITEENIQEFNTLMKTKAPKRLCYFWQQYILFREGTPSSYMSSDNLVEKPLKTSSYNSNIKNLNVISTVWAIIVAVFFLVAVPASNDMLTVSAVAGAIIVIALIYVINLIFTIYLRARKNALLNSIFQNVSLFGRFMDNACVDLPSYIDYQILFTPQEIEKGQPVLREFLDYKARREKEEFNRAKEQDVEYEKYDFSSTGVNGSVVLDRAMKESEIFLKKKEKAYVRIAQLESELDTRKKNFDNVQKDYQNKLQASRENIDRLLQQQEETTNRIESNYLRKQQTQEIAKQEQLEQEFEQQRARYLLEKNELEEEIKKLQNELDESKQEVEKAMLGEYQNFFNNFCISAEKVVTTVMAGKMNKLTKENQEQQERITELEIKLKNSHQGVFDATNAEQGNEGQYDMEGNFVYANGAYYDKEGLYHDLDGKVYDANGTFIRQDENFEPKHIEVKEKQEEVEEPETDKPVDLNSLDAFDYMTDIAEKDDIYGVAEDVIKNVDSDIKVVNSGEKRTKSVEPILDETNAVENITNEEPVESANEGETQMVEMEPVDLNAESVETEKVEEKPKKKAGRPRKIVAETVQKPKGKRGRPRKVAPATTVSEPAKKKPGRPKKIVNETATQSAQSSAKRPVGRPKKIVNEQAVQKPKGKRGRPKKNLNSIEIEEINKKITEQQNKLSEMRDNLNREFEVAMKNLDSSKIVDNETRKNELFNEIEKLKEEAKSVNSTDSESKISSINQRLEALIEEVKKLNS
mgnify:FL=1